MLEAFILPTPCDAMARIVAKLSGYFDQSIFPLCMISHDSSKAHTSIFVWRSHDVNCESIRVLAQAFILPTPCDAMACIVAAIQDYEKPLGRATNSFMVLM